MTINSARGFVAYTAGAFLVLLAAGANAGHDEVLRGVAEISGCTDSAINGTAIFIEKNSDEGVKEVTVHLQISGLPEGKHAVHIHAVADCATVTTACSAAGGHFDPGPAGNTSPDGNHPFHSGDLINIDVGRGGVGTLETTTSRITLSPGPLSIFDADGSALIVHVNPDTYCPDGVVAGCAGGARAACGVIERVQ